MHMYTFFIVFYLKIRVLMKVSFSSWNFQITKRKVSYIKVLVIIISVVICVRFLYCGLALLWSVLLHAFSIRVSKSMINLEMLSGMFFFHVCLYIHVSGDQQSSCRVEDRSIIYTDLCVNIYYIFIVLSLLASIRRSVCLLQPFMSSSCKYQIAFIECMSARLFNKEKTG